MEKEINGREITQSMWPGQEEFNRFIIKNKVIGFKEKDIELKSGRKSRFYANWRIPLKDAHTTDVITDFVIDFLDYHGLKPTCVYGVPEGATKVGIITTFKLAMRPGATENYCLAQGRGEPKKHGDPKDRNFVGAPEGDTVPIEDVTTTGGSLLDTLDRVVALPNTHVLAVVGLTNRMELRDDGKSVVEAVAAKGFRYLAMSEAPTLLKLEYAVRKPSEETAQLVEEEFKKYGVAPLKLR